MPLHWRPVGPHPAATYWWRRGGLAAVLLVLLALVLFLAGRGSGPDRLAAVPRASATSAPPRPASTASPTAAASASASDTTQCPDAALSVDTKTDASSYAAGAKVVLTMTVKNIGTTPCRRALGQAAVEVLITSGADRIWSSDDCSPGGGDGEVVLPAGGSQTATVTWPGTRSAPGCPTARPAAQPGTYRVTARVGDLHVPGPGFQIA